MKALGYLEDDERSCFLHDDEWCGDLLTLAESARGRPYRASEGAFSRYVRTLLKPQLAEPKSNAVRRFKDLERRAFEDKPDPFSVVGGLQPVSRMDYEANRSWDGIDPLMRALAAIPDDTVAHAHTLAGLDRAADDLLRLKSDLLRQLQDYRRQDEAPRVWCTHGYWCAAADWAVFVA